MENTRSSSRRRRQHYSQSDGLLHEVPALLGHHEKQLVEGSAIDPEVIEARGYRSIEESKELGDFPKDVQKLVPGFRVPVWTVDGERGSPQYRPDEPRDNPKKPGKKNKYENRWRAPVRLDVHPWNSAQKLFDVSVALHITEGIKKADSGTSRGLCVVALLGVDCWQREGKPLADWDSIPLKDRVVYLEFDSDLMEKREVQRALRKLKRFLESRGATVKVVYFEAKPNGEKVGLDVP